MILKTASHRITVWAILWLGDFITFCEQENNKGLH